MAIASNGKVNEIAADAVIVGGGVGGFAAALALLEAGRSVVLTEETDWIGGQLTAQAVPPDEHPWIEQFGSTARYREYRARVREFYKQHYPLTPEARSRRSLNPGDGSVSRLCHEPRVSLAVLTEWIQSHLSSGRLTLLLEHRPLSADVDGDRVRAVMVRSLRTGRELVLRAPYFVDATELGELLPMTGTEYVVGAEGQSQTGEPHAPAEPNPANQQAFTVCFAMDYLPAEDHTIERPEEYDFWRNYVPEMTPPWPGRLLALVGSHPQTLEAREYRFDPEAESRNEWGGLWRYRRILHRGNFVPGAFASDLCLVNWPMNDYWLGNLIDVSEEEASHHLRMAKQLSLSLLYWLQTEAPRPDGGQGWPGLRLRGDVVGTEDGLAKYPYIRESRRIRAEFTVLEQHVGTEARMAETGLPREEVTAASFFDSVGVGSYRIDLHPSSGGDNYIDISSLPFEIPLGALLPVRMENLLPACKNIGTTHITNGCYRLHPVEWNIGESVGLLIAHALDRNLPPRGVRNNRAELERFQRRLTAAGVEIRWPRLRPR
ncbi:MAG: FAD-dependent oxidoreductase [Candidatus Poribacteria bacterium]|nr:MAG: FAD-dependent oxidoreductase [Candidatus Poribacteria bacterium]